MCWMCDHPGSTVADFLDVIRAKIAKRGWAVQYVEDPRMPFAYTAGMTGLLLPELLMTNVSPARAARVLNGVAGLLVDGLELWPGRQVSLPGGPLVEVVEVDQPDVHLPAAVALHGPIRAFQLVWADGRGRWPWAADFCDQESRQPVLGMRTTASPGAQRR
ncbi:DUF4262 domain-containing protein [Candidatus Mycolicibacterium alkanivorans]|uniref:DUF4262 domain-containing protein n=1 Tax=Candidatus Mycolicibacterium alkanivorans TaxID=2954114 RepID=A0ABS9YSH8_9MYCO|nr:DUF4262 domain-containing protein [Candidatus Mycolicibacterium alkanivorans]MCI4674174.1 DUF4262 domain-containing protein [Candidatus Mycolicibacterium alkanivorans]